jgi:RNA polymerase sigma factor for flagellar operon FliA
MNTWEKYKKKKTIKLRNLLIMENMGLVRSIANKVKKKYYLNYDLEDLVSYGIFGLINAIERYDPIYKIKFSSYASARIHGSILDELRKIDWVPRTVRNKIRNVRKEISFGDKRSPIEEYDLAKKNGLSLIDYHVMTGNHFVSLNSMEN